MEIESYLCRVLYIPIKMSITGNGMPNIWGPIIPRKSIELLGAQERVVWTVFHTWLLGPLPLLFGPHGTGST